MHHDPLFIETLADFRRRAQRGVSEYEVVMVAALLRKLLLDSPTLVDLVNRQRREKIEYVVNGRPPVWKILNEPPPVAYAVEDGLDEPPPFGVPVALDRSGLLAHVVLAHRGSEITVRDLIRYVAHSAGGVHFGPPKTEAEKAAQPVAHTMPPVAIPLGVGPS
jgi:hypothetical protein